MESLAKPAIWILRIYNPFYRFIEQDLRLKSLHLWCSGRLVKYFLSNPVFDRLACNLQKRFNGFLLLHILCVENLYRVTVGLSTVQVAAQLMVCTRAISPFERAIAQPYCGSLKENCPSQLTVLTKAQVCPSDALW